MKSRGRLGLPATEGGAVFALIALALLSNPLSFPMSHGTSNPVTVGRIETNTQTRDHSLQPEAISAVSGWYLNITNLANVSDYPRTVIGGHPYVVNVTATATVPSGQMGTLQLTFNQLDVDPAPFRAVYFSNTTVLKIDLPVGNTTLTRSVAADTPVVYRDSFNVGIGVFGLVHDRNGSYVAGSGSNFYEVAVQPVNPAQDVKFTGTVEKRYYQAYSPFLGGLSGVDVKVTSVQVDPTGSFSVGQIAFVRLGGLWSAMGISLHDIIWVSGDTSPEEGSPPFVGIWKAYHYVARVGSRNRDPSLDDPKVEPTSGDERTTFVFSVRCGDVDEDAFDAFLLLDGVRILMDYVEGSNVTGALYSLAMKVPSGEHTYAFLVNDRFGAPNSENATMPSRLVVGSFSTVVVASVSAIIGAAGAVAVYVVLMKWRRAHGTGRQRRH